jgi:hypothetical protein
MVVCRILLGNIFMLSIFLSFSQENEELYFKNISPKHTYHVDVGLPVPTSNKPFRQTMQALLNVNTGYQFTMQNQLAFGFGVHYSYFKINQFRVPEKILGGVHSYGGYGKFSVEKFHSKRFGTDFGLKVGYLEHQFVSDTNQVAVAGTLKMQSIYVEPMASFILTAEENIAYSFNIAYTFYNFQYHPNLFGFKSTAGYKESDFKKITQFLTVGFGFRYYFKEH